MTPRVPRSVAAPAARGLAAGRTRLALALRSRVAGENADAEAAAIWGRPGERRFGPDDVVWRVHADATMFVGGIRALLLQSLHPLAMAGVAGHSGYKGDPWGRLQRTSHFIATTTFGTIPDARAAIARVRGIHERVRGRAPDSRPYRASDPHLLRWVHVAEAQSFLSAYEAYGPAPLSPAERDTYVEQAAGVARALGASDVPTTHAGLLDAIEAFRPELEVTTAAREAARFLLLSPPLPLVQRPGYGMLAAGAVADLQPWARRMLGLPASAAADALLGRPLGHASVGTVRWALLDPAIAQERRARPPQE